MSANIPNNGHAITISQCKVCNSKFRNVIEELSTKNMSPEKIYAYLQSLTDPEQQMLIVKENINPSSIRRHLKSHFKQDEVANVKLAETHSKIEYNRNLYKEGKEITVDKINSLNYMIEDAVTRIEEIEVDISIPNSKKYQLINQYMLTAKTLIESLAKLTGELKQEGTIDINFFSTEITSFANIVLECITELDNQLNLNGKVVNEFAGIFQKKWTDYKTLQTAVINGEVAQTKKVVHNTFNEDV
jgi:hypothetical protein